jgi:hypothetical protein
LYTYVVGDIYPFFLRSDTVKTYLADVAMNIRVNLGAFTGTTNIPDVMLPVGILRIDHSIDPVILTQYFLYYSSAVCSLITLVDGAVGKYIHIFLVIVIVI